MADCVAVRGAASCRVGMEATHWTMRAVASLDGFIHVDCRIAVPCIVRIEGVCGGVEAHNYFARGGSPRSFECRACWSARGLERLCRRVEGGGATEGPAASGGGPGRNGGHCVGWTVASGPKDAGPRARRLPGTSNRLIQTGRMACLVGRPGSRCGTSMVRARRSRRAMRASRSRTFCGVWGGRFWTRWRLNV